MSDDVFLVVGGGVLQCYMIDEAHAMGLKVICTDQDPSCAGAHRAEAFYQLSTRQAFRHRVLPLRTRRHWHVVGVATCGADCAPAVAHAAMAYGTRGLSPAIAKVTHNKAAVRQTLTSAGLDRIQPRYRLVTSRQQVFPLPRFPVVVKPSDNCASRGVSIVETPAALGPAFQRAQAARHHRHGPILLEECLRGTEFSAEIILASPEHVVYENIAQRLFTYDAGIPLEIGHINPAPIALDAWQQMIALVRQVATCLGVLWGPFKCDVIWTSDGPKMLECAARLSGGFDCQEAVPRSTGRRPVRTVIELACGMPLTPPPAPVPVQYTACVGAFFPPGPVRRLPPPHPDVVYTVRPGDCVEPPTHCATRAAFLFATAPTPEAAQATAATRARALVAAYSLLRAEEGAHG